MRREITTIALFTFLEAVRNRFFWLVLCGLVAGLMLAEFAGGLAITESAEIRSAVLGAGLRLFAVFVVSLFVASSMVREFNDKVLDLVLSLPLPRGAYYFGKLAGYSLIALAVTVAVGLSVALFVPPLQALLWSVSLACELLIVVAVTLLCVFTFTQVTTALSAAAAFYVLSRSIGALQLMGHGPLVDPGAWSQRVITGFLDALAFVLPTLYRFSPSQWLVYHTGHWHDLLPVLAQCAVYVLLLTGAGLFDFYRRSF